MRQPTDHPYKPPSDQYQGDELQQNPGLLPERMRAFTLPSRNGNWLHYPDGRRTPFPVGH